MIYIDVSVVAKLILFSNEFTNIYILTSCCFDVFSWSSYLLVYLWFWWITFLDYTFLRKFNTDLIAYNNVEMLSEMFLFLIMETMCAVFYFVVSSCLLSIGWWVKKCHATRVFSSSTAKRRKWLSLVKALKIIIHYITYIDDICFNVVQFGFYHSHFFWNCIYFDNCWWCCRFYYFDDLIQCL